MGIRINCPGCGHKMNLKSFLAGKRGVCPKCHTKFDIPAESDGDAGGGEESQIATVQANGAARRTLPAPQPVARQSPSPASVNPQHAGQPQPTPVQPQPAPQQPQPIAQQPQPAPVQPAPRPVAVQPSPVQPVVNAAPQVSAVAPAVHVAPQPVQPVATPRATSPPDPLLEAPTRRGTCGRLQADSLAPPKAT